MNPNTQEHTETESTGRNSYVVNRTRLSINPVTNDSTFVYESMPQVIGQKINHTPSFKERFYQKDGQWFSDNPHRLDIEEWINALRERFPSKEVKLVRKNQDPAGPMYLNGVTVTPRGNRATTYKDWSYANDLELGLLMVRNIHKATDKFAKDYIAPVMMTAMTPGSIIPGTLASIGANMLDQTVETSTKGKASNWGDMVGDALGVENKKARTALNYTNPFRLYSMYSGVKGMHSAGKNIRLFGDEAKNTVYNAFDVGLSVNSQP